MWDGMPAAGRSLRWMWVWRYTEVACTRYGVTTLSGVSSEDNLKSAPEEPGWP